jgi:hypothetical protein
MATGTAPSKVTAAHLSRAALLYIRQSTLKQVIRNTESSIRQYDLRGKAIALGWAADQITVIDIDQGHSGASAADRERFQHLVAEVSLGRAGIAPGRAYAGRSPVRDRRGRREIVAGGNVAAVEQAEVAVVMVTAASPGNATRPANAIAISPRC